MHNHVTVLNILIPFVCDLDDVASMPESLPSDTDAETEQLVDTTELADEPVAEPNSTSVWRNFCVASVAGHHKDICTGIG